MSRHAVAVAIAWGLAANTAHAEGQVWVSAGVSAKPAKRVEVQVGPQLRFGDDTWQLVGVLPEASARYRIKKWLRVGGGYRYEYERVGRSELFVTTHRASLDARVRHDLGDLRVDYRLMLAEKYKPVTESFKTELRNRVDVAYRAWRPWIPYAGSELFVALGDFDKFAYDKLRLTAGVVYARADHDIELFVRTELHADAMEPTFYVLGFGYQYELL
jgi:hypothetical protein